VEDSKPEYARMILALTDFEHALEEFHNNKNIETAQRLIWADAKITNSTSGFGGTYREYGAGDNYTGDDTPGEPVMDDLRRANRSGHEVVLGYAGYGYNNSSRRATYSDIISHEQSEREKMRGTHKTRD
jgi:hypothetical protein